MALRHLLDVNLGHAVVLGEVLVPARVEVRVLHVVGDLHVLPFRDLPRAHGLLLALLLLLPQHLELLVRAVRLEVVALLLALAPVLLEDAQEFQDLGVGLLAGLVRLARFYQLEKLCEVDGRRLGHVEALDELSRGLLLEADLL